MDENGKPGTTDAQLQIEKLMKLKQEREKKDSMKFEFRQEHAAKEKKQEIQEPAEPAEKAVSPKEKKPANTVRIEKRLYEKLHRIVNRLNASGGAKITKSAFVNAVIKEFIALELDYSLIKDGEAMKKIFARLKQDS